MTSERGLVKYEGQQMTVPDLRSLAGDFAKSGYFQDAKEVFQAVVKIQAGLELGFGPVYSMTKIYIVKGKVMVSAEALGAMIKRSGRYDYSVKTLMDTECILEFTDAGKVVYTSKFTMDDARRADLVKTDSGWAKWPRAMLMSKSLSQGARIVCPHVIAGVYTPADFGVETDEGGEPVKVTIESLPVKAEPPPVEMISDAQRRKIFAAAKEKGYSEEWVKNLVWNTYVKAHTTDLTKAEAMGLIDFIEKSEYFVPSSTPAEATDTAKTGPPATATTTTVEEPPTDKFPNGIERTWLKEQVTILQKKAPKMWGEDNITAWMVKTYKVEGKTILECASKLDKNAAIHFVKRVQTDIEMVSGR